MGCCNISQNIKNVLCYFEIKISVNRKIRTFCTEILKKAFQVFRKKSTFFRWDCSLASTRQWNGFCVFLWFPSYNFNAFSFQRNQIPSLKSEAVRPAHHKIRSVLGTGLELGISLFVPTAHCKSMSLAFFLLHLLREKANNDLLILCNLK